MFNVNVDNVINGNPYKALSIKYSELLSTNDDASAKEYYDYYSTLPLSVIMSSSPLIFKESRYGIKFYTDIIKSEFIPFYMYEEQYVKMRNFIQSVNDFSEDEQRDYNEALSILECKMDSCKKVMTPFSIELTESLSLISGSVSDIQLMNQLYKHKYEYGDTVGNDIIDPINDIIGTRVGFILYAPAIFSRVPLDSLCMDKLNTYFVSNCVGYGDFSNTAYSVILLRLMYQDPMYAELVNSVRNRRFREVINQWLNTDPMNLINGVLCKPDEKDVMTVNNVIESSDDVFDAIFNSMNTIDAMEEADPIFRDRTEAKRCIYEYYAECLSTIMIHGNDFPISGNTIFGENRSVLKDMTDCDIYSERCADSLGEFVSYGSRYSYDDHKLIEEEVRDYFESDEDTEDDEEDDNSEDSTTDNDESDEPDSDNEPENPNKKLGIKERLTHKALDADKKAREVEAKMDDRATATKKLGKAATAIPRHIQKNIDDAAEEVRNAKVNNLQRRLLKDGYRNAWWNKIKTAIKYKMVGSVSTLLMPMYWLARKARKTNDKRLKNEVIANFNLELDILKDKYNQADKADDMEAKEKLRRDIDKMERELKRVKYNARAIN